MSTTVYESRTAEFGNGIVKSATVALWGTSSSAGEFKAVDASGTEINNGGVAVMLKLAPTDTTIND